MAGDGATLEGAARKASSSLPILLQMGKVTKEELVNEMTAIQLEHDIYILDGVAIPLAICRKVGIHNLSLIAQFCKSKK